MFVGRLHEVDIFGVATIGRTYSWNDKEQEDKSIYMEHQSKIESAKCSYITQNDLPEDSQIPQLYFVAAIVPVDDYYSDE